MKHIFTLLLIFSAFGLQAQSCAPAHHVNPPFIVVPDTIDDWHTIEEAPCFGNATCSDFVNPFNEIVNFDISTALAGYFAIIVTGHPTTDQAALTIMSRDCDSVLAQRCLNWPIDTIHFLNTTSKFSLWFQSVYDTIQVIYRGWMPTGPQIMPSVPILCGVATSFENSLPSAYTYRQFAPYTGTLSEPSESIPQGLSLRSDGAKVLRQGVPDGLAMIFAMIAMLYILAKCWRLGNS